MATKKTTTKAKRAATPRKKTIRNAQEIRELASRVAAAHEIDLDAAKTLLQQKDEAKPGIPAYTLVVAVFGHAVARAAFSKDLEVPDETEAPEPAPEAKPAKEKKARASRAPRPAKEPREPAVAVGTKLVREYRKRGEEPTTITVERTDDGFVWGKTTFPSLTAAAKAITGYPSISGPYFFGLSARRNRKAERAAQPAEA